MPFVFIFNLWTKVTLLSSYLQSFYLLQSNNYTMGFLDKLRRKKDETVEKVKEQTTTPQPTHPTNAEPPPPPGRRIKRYTSEGKPIYE
jgi:hypothetical protein